MFFGGHGVEGFQSFDVGGKKSPGFCCI